METFNVRTRIEGALASQLALSGGDAALERVVEALLAVLEPTLRAVAVELAEQAAAEVGSQLPDYEVTVTIEGGEPFLHVRPLIEDLAGMDYEARLTLRLPDAIKERVEAAAGATGESVNAWVVKALSSKVRERRGMRVQRRIQL
jgi:organic radical activating enzyme